MDRAGIAQQSSGAVDRQFIICCAAALLLCCAALLLSCSSTDIKREVQMPQEAGGPAVRQPLAPSPPATPDYVPVTEDISALKTKIVDIAARNTPLRDVLYVIADAANTGLIMEKGVQSDAPVTLTLKNVTAEDALNAVFASVDYFYSLKDGMLVVKALDTRIFELGHPAIVQTYSVDVGGDILGGASGTTGASGTGSTLSANTASQSVSSSSLTAANNIKGSVTQSAKSDNTAFNFWDAVEKSLATMLASTAPQATGAPAAPAGATSPGFTVNRLTGTIVVTASKKNIERVEQYLNTLKKVLNRQVLVEAKVVEVQLSDGLKYGIDWNFLENWRGVGRINLGTKGYSNVVANTSPSFTLGTTGVNFTSLLNALQQQGEVRTLSNPRVNIMNGQTALLSVGRNVTIISRVDTTTTAVAGSTPLTTFTIGTSTILSGIIIGIVPYINEYGEVSLTITPIISDLVSLEEKTVGQAGQNQTQISLPTVDLRELSTTVKVRDGQMVVIGGLISKKESLDDSKVPGIGNAPVVGGLFTRRDKSESRSELVVVLQPVIVSR